jgi:hypothetical protein
MRSAEELVSNWNSGRHTLHEDIDGGRNDRRTRSTIVAIEKIVRQEEMRRIRRSNREGHKI